MSDENTYQNEPTNYESINNMMEDIFRGKPAYDMRITCNACNGTNDWCVSLLDQSWPNFISITSGKTFKEAIVKMRDAIVKACPLDHDLQVRMTSRHRALKLTCEDMVAILGAIRENWRLFSHEFIPKMERHATWQCFQWILTCDHIIQNNANGMQELHNLLHEDSITKALPRGLHKRQSSMLVTNMARIWFLGNKDNQPYLLFMTKNSDDKFFNAVIDACSIWFELHEKQKTSEEK